jgi:hypothetical protein
MSGSHPGVPSAPPRQLRSGSIKKEPPLSAQKLFNEVSRAIVGASESQELVYEDIDPAIGSRVVLSLNEDPGIEQARPRWVKYQMAIP